MLQIAYKMAKQKIHIIDFLTLAHAFNKARMNEFYQLTGTNIYLIQIEYKYRGYKDLKSAIDDVVSIQYNSANEPKASDFNIDYTALPAGSSHNGFVNNEDGHQKRNYDLGEFKQDLNALIILIKTRMDEKNSKEDAARIARNKDKATARRTRTSDVWHRGYGA